MKRKQRRSRKRSIERSRAYHHTIHHTMESVWYWASRNEPTLFELKCIEHAQDLGVLMR